MCMTRLLRGALLVGAGLAAACEELPNVPPTAAFIFSPVSPIVAGRTGVVFNASASSDSDGRIVSYAWEFGDGSPAQTVSETSVVHVFPNTLATCIQVTYAVLLTVLDDGGGRSSASQQVNVTEDCTR
jgi:hypothetical protein